MPRRSNRGRVKLKYPMSFRRMCDSAGITPKERIKLIKHLKHMRGGELN